jgi:hypothetical protein
MLHFQVELAALLMVKDAFKQSSSEAELAQIIAKVISVEKKL